MSQNTAILVDNQKLFFWVTIKIHLNGIGNIRKHSKAQFHGHRWRPGRNGTINGDSSGNYFQWERDLKASINVQRIRLKDHSFGHTFFYNIAYV